MDGHCVIKVLLRRAHLDGHSESLQHLIGTLAEDVDTHHLNIHTS